MKLLGSLKHWFRVLLNLAKPLLHTINATASERPTTVLHEPSTKEDPWKLIFLSWETLHLKTMVKDPPSPIVSIMAGTRTPENHKKEY